jgi:hypothetical protein
VKLPKSKDYRIEVDEQNYTLKYKTRVIGYYPTMQAAINRYIEVAAISDDTTLRSYIARLNKLYKEIKHG